MRTLPELKDFKLPSLKPLQHNRTFCVNLISNIDEEIHLSQHRLSEESLKKLVKLKKEICLRYYLATLALTIIKHDLFRMEQNSNCKKVKTNLAKKSF